MAYVDWMISGPKIASCSCDYGCPCEFNARPTNPVCEGMEAQRIDEGWFGPVVGEVARGRFGDVVVVAPGVDDPLQGLSPDSPAPGTDAMLDALWVRCAEGSASACDELFFTSEKRGSMTRMQVGIAQSPMRRGRF